MYVELHAASAFSFLDGASLPEALVERAGALGYPALALLDRDGVYGAPRFHLAAKRAGIKAIIGAELTMAIGTAASVFRLPVLVESREGYRNLCRLVTRMKLRSPKGEGALAIEELDGHVAGLVALVGRTALSGPRFGVGGLVDRIVGTFGAGNVCIEVQRHLLREEEADNQALVDLASAFHVPVVATNGVRFAAPANRPLYDVLTCIRHKTTLERAGRRLTWNAERYLKSPDAMSRLFSDMPGAVAATRDLADRLGYTMADLGYRFPDYPVPAGETMPSFLRKIAQAGARERYRPYADRARRQVERELDLIEKLELSGYFLIVWDIVNYCRQQDILVQGRGSAANSAVCYSLGITAVDPVGMDLLFERFLSEERGEWPDIDLDLPSGDRRERAIQHLYEKYGNRPLSPGAGSSGARTVPEGPRIAPEGPRIAMTANVITYRGRSAAREVGKALSLEAAQVDRLAKVMNHFEWVDPKDTLERNLREVGLDFHHPVIQTFGRLWSEIQDLPRHLGQHSGGMVICHGRLDDVVPLENASMPNRVVVQWDKDDCADMGIVKVDLLGLGMMAVIQDSLKLVPNLDLAHLPQEDPAVYRMLQEADTIGVFQVESRAQMATLPRLKPTTFYDLVVEVAIIRPGPIVGQMVHPYLNRRAGREPVQYPHPSLEPILKRTLGVPLFQEQLLRLAMVAAGFTGGQAEDLRRAMGFKRSEKRMKQIEIQLREGMAKNGITGEAAEQIVTSIASFALYGFPESHAASFALLAYASAYLKVHYPAAFYTALLNNQPMGFYHPSTLVKDAQRRGVRFHPIDAQVSDWDCTVEGDGGIRLGLRYVHGLREQIGRAIAGASHPARPASAHPASPAHPAMICPKCGCDDESMMEPTDRGWFCNVCSHDWNPEKRKSRRYTSLDELVARTGLRRDEVVTLADVGALNTFGYDRRSALWQVERAVRPGGELFTPTTINAETAELAEIDFENENSAGSASSAFNVVEPCPLKPMTEAERLVADYAGMGLTVGRHPMALRRDDLAMRGILRARDLSTARQGRRVRVAGMVITRQRPGTAKGFVFLTLEDETGIANIIVRPDLFARDRLVIIEEPFLIVDGVLQNQDGVTSVRAEQVQGMRGVDVDFDAHDFY